ncbi:hypothetical protein V6Z11_A05G278700 [Gossypium hirsutum]
MGFREAQIKGGFTDNNQEVSNNRNRQISHRSNHSRYSKHVCPLSNNRVQAYSQNRKHACPSDCKRCLRERSNLLHGTRRPESTKLAFERTLGKKSRLEDAGEEMGFNDSNECLIFSGQSY